jgi:hypothetical protein
MSEQVSNPAPAMTAPGFIEDAKGVLQQVRNSLNALVDAVGADASQPQEMARRFSLDKTLAWKIARVVGSEDTWSAAAHIPGRAGVRTFIDALERAGAPRQRAESVREAMDSFEALIERHSGDRDTFEIMLGGISDQMARKQGETFRKMAYLGNSAIWGVQARVHLSTHFMSPSRKAADMLDYAAITGLTDFRRLRHDVPWAVSSRMTYTDEGKARDNGFHFPPMDPAVGPSEPPILREFCSTPTPELRAVHTNNATRFEFTEGPVGHTASSTCALGWLILAGSSRYRTSDDRFGESATTVNTPVETLYLDVYVHRDLDFPTPKLLAYSRMPGGPSYPHDGARGQLPVTEEITDLGCPPDVIVPGVPRYGQMVAYATERLGYPAREFHGFRFRLRYPPVPSLVLYRFELPERP